MAENQTGVAEQAEFTYPVQIEEAGPGTKRVTIEIPAERIAAKLEENFKELRQKAAIPGFRAGHAPRKLVEKKFATDVREDVRRNLVSESYQQAIQKNNLKVLGEPDFGADQKLELPESGSLKFSFEVEIAPEFTLPELTGIAVKRPKVEVTDEHRQQAMNNLRQQQGVLVPVENRGLEANDYVTADVAVKCEGKEVGAQKDAMFMLTAGRIAGLFIEDLDKQLAGVKSGENKTITIKAPADFGNAELAGKDVELAIAVKDIKKLEPAEINEEFLTNLGFKDEAELIAALGEQLEIRVKNDVQQAMRDQVSKFLFDGVVLNLPTKMSQRQTQRVIQRRATDLMSRGVPQAQIEANIEKLKTGAEEAAVRELKMYFILERLAEQLEIDVDEAELNGQVAMMAAQYGERPEKMKQQLSKDGTLANMYLKLRENRALDKVIESAKIEDVELPKPEEKKA
jgi:trigger factor